MGVPLARGDGLAGDHVFFVGDVCDEGGGTRGAVDDPEVDRWPAVGERDLLIGEGEGERAESGTFSEDGWPLPVWADDVDGRERA